MKKKLFSVIACLFMSIGLIRATYALELSCGGWVYTVSFWYFMPASGTLNDYNAALAEYKRFLYDIDQYYCSAVSAETSTEAVEDTVEDTVED